MTDSPSQRPVQSSGATAYRRNVRDYQFGTRIGEGSYSTVYLAVDLHNKKTYAIKVLSKKHIVRENKIKYVNIEKTALHRLGQQHPGIVQLYYTFQDEQKLYFVLDFAEYGELLSILSKFGSLLEAVLKFYMLQILDAVKFIHLKGMIHRDLKPENILVGYDFNLKITDFGTAKLLGSDEDDAQERIDYDAVPGGVSQPLKDRKTSFVGTAEYVPPELLKYNACGFETDIWAIACILYQFFHGLPPFKGGSEYLTFEKIIHIDYVYHRQLPPMVKEIIDRTLVFSPQDRPSISEIQAMPWFAGVPWNNREYLWNRAAPRFEPYVSPNQSSSTQQYSLPPPQLKNGSNRHAHKSNSNFMLQSQLQKSDNLFPSIGAKKTYQPATRVNQVPASPSTPKFQGAQNQAQSPSRQEYSYHSQGYQSDQYGKPQNMNGPQLLASPSRNFKSAAPPSPYNGNNYVGQPERQIPGPNGLVGISNSHLQAQHLGRQDTAFQIAKVASQAVMPPLEKQMSEATLGPPQSPERKDLRQNTAFATLSRQSPTAEAIPDSKKPPAAKVSPDLHSPNSEVQPRRLVKPRRDIPQTMITIKEITSFLEPDEKIVKLDSILKLRLKNSSIRKKSGNLDNESTEKIIEQNQITLDSDMKPVVACVSNKARLFLIDGDLNVLMIDLAANKGHDYLMYDYEFESVFVDSDDSDGEQGEDVFGYLIIEMIQENGDLVFLKRFSEDSPPELRNSVRVVGANGDTIRIGSELGWIDCLIRTKKIMDDEKLQQRTAPLAPSAQIKGSAGSSTTKIANGAPVTPKLGSSPQLNKKKSPTEKKALNNFALAAAAAAHR